MLLLKNLDAISIDGGAYKTILFIGALAYLSTKKDLTTIKYLHGSSAGAIIALFLTLNISPKSMMKFGVTFDLTKMLTEDIHSLDINRMMVDFDGCADGNSILQNISKGISKYSDLWTESMTFQELYKATNKHLVITTTNITQHCIQNFDYHTHPDVPVLLAIRMSIGIPGAFRPYTFLGMQYIDGNVFCQNPVDVVRLFPQCQQMLWFCVPNSSLNNNIQKNFFSLLINLIRREKTINEKKIIHDEQQKKKIIEISFDDRFTSAFDCDPNGLAKIFLDGAFQFKTHYDALSSVQPH